MTPLYNDVVGPVLTAQPDRTYIIRYMYLWSKILVCLAGLRKKMMAKTMHLPDAREWIKSTINHMYYVAATAPVEVNTYWGFHCAQQVGGAIATIILCHTMSWIVGVPLGTDAAVAAYLSQYFRSITITLLYVAVQLQKLCCLLQILNGHTRHEYIEDMWLSLENHAHDMHVHHSQIYPFCQHAPIEPPHNRRNLWLQRGSRDSGVFIDLITNARLLKDIKKLSPSYQTSSLEAYHSLLLKFTPKHTHFSWLGMMAR